MLSIDDFRDAGVGWRAVVGLLLVSTLAACALPGTDPSAGPDGSATPVVEARCAVGAGTPPEVGAEPEGTVTSPAAPTAAGSGHPMTDEQLREEEFLRQQAANKAFRQRGTLDPAAAGGAHTCAVQVQYVLDLLTADDQETPGEETVRQAVAGTGLMDVTVRPPGRLDLGPGDGLLFSGWTGRACVFGSVRSEKVTVEFGTRVADGGCLPAPG
ncbi:hypothetical protein [Micromonospora sp. DT229]|uniref:hypothetical protein n=1 Tax=Micromonospora sp. DT229 TaxID=3393430 RepID=UPI003CEC8E3A